MPLNAVVYDHVDVIFRLSAAGEVLTKLAGKKGVYAALGTWGARRPGEEPSLAES